MNINKGMFSFVRVEDNRGNRLPVEDRKVETERS